VAEPALNTVVELSKAATPELKKLLDTSDSELTEDVNALLHALDRFNIAANDDSTNRHDLLNAVAAVMGYAEMVLELDRDLPPTIRARVQHIADVLSASTKNPAHSTKSTRSLDTFEGCTVLVVDDLPENLDLMSRLLRKMACSVITADSGAIALDLLEQESVDLVLLDLVMPSIDGREVLARIKQSEQHRAIPVIMISGRQDMDQIVDCIQVGADDYLLKPVNSVLLSARIKSGLERKRWHDKEEQYREQLEKRELFIRQTFGRYISDAIVDEILENPEGLKLGGDLRSVTLMMSDIRSFTTLVEHLPPEKVVTLLNRYLGKMTDIILEHGGTIDEFLGDAVLAAFGAPTKTPDHAQRAVTCAIAMQAAMDDINAQNKADGLPEIEMAIALNTGEVVAGNIGSERRSKYGFVGHEVNVTSRIEDAALPREILVSERTLKCLDLTGFNVGESRSLNPKGIEEKLSVFPIYGEMLRD
jgi:class 3 adenylate cyclase